MKNYIEFLMLDVSPGIDYTITVPDDMPAGELARILLPHMQRCTISNVTVRDCPKDNRLDECMDLVFNATDPGEHMTEADAEATIARLKNEGWDVPEMLTPALFLELYNDLEPVEEK